MQAGEYISYAMNNLGLSETKDVQPQVLYERLRWVVRALQDAQIHVEERVNIATVAGQAAYAINKRYEQIMGVIWPVRYLEIVPSLTGSHSVPSDITGDIGPGPSGPRWVTRNELESHQQYATAAGGIGTVPYIWTHYREGGETVLMLAPVANVQSGETIIVRMSLAEAVSYSPNTDLNVEERYDPVLRYRMCEQAAEYAAGLFLRRAQPGMAQQYRTEANRYRNLADEELRTVKQTHRSGFTHAEVKKVDTPSLPPTYE